MKNKILSFLFLFFSANTFASSNQPNLQNMKATLQKILIESIRTVAQQRNINLPLSINSQAEFDALIRRIGRQAYEQEFQIRLNELDINPLLNSRIRESKFSQISATSDHVLTLIEGRVYANGINSFGALGIGDDLNHVDPTLLFLPGNERVIQVATGGCHSLILTASRKVYVMGWNAYGALGLGQNRESRSTPTLLVLPAEIDPIAQIVAYDNTSFLLTQSGEVYTFGESYERPLFRYKIPTHIPLHNRPIVQIAPGQEHTLFLTSSGEVLILGIKTYDGFEAKYFESPTQIILPSKEIEITQIASGGSYSLLLSKEGEVFSLGEEKSNHGIPKRIPLDPSETVIQVAVGTSHSLLLTKSGRVYGLGSNSKHALGISNDVARVPVQIPIPFGETVVQIYAGHHHSRIQTQNGNTYVFGSNRLGILGIGDQETRRRPTLQNPSWFRSPEEYGLLPLHFIDFNEEQKIAMLQAVDTTLSIVPALMLSLDIFFPQNSI